jgi:formate dehydrogenase accessory protein FdhE
VTVSALNQNLVFGDKNMKEERTFKNLYQELEKVKTKAKESYNEGKIKINRVELQKRIALSQYLIDFNSLEIDGKWLERLFKEYVLTLKRFTKNGVAENELEQCFEREKLDLETLVKKVFCFDSHYLEVLAQKLELKIEDLFYWGVRLGTPVFELYAAKLKEKIDPDRWLKGYCPVCGSSPAMAYLRHDDGKRILWCRFCGTRWSFLRLKCPFCSNEDQSTLRYFFTDEDDPYRVYVCDKCKKYVKTIDQRKLKEETNLDLAWEDLETLTLDVLAQKDGYSTLPAGFRV